MKNKETIDDLVLDEHNFNLHTQEGMDLIKKSITRNKFGRSILVDKDNNVIAGNGVVETARACGKSKIKVVETEGDELIVVRRKDISIDSQEGRELALADNQASAVGLRWNDEELKKVSEQWGIDLPDWKLNIAEIGGGEEKKETEKLSDIEYKSMYYTPKNMPHIRLEDCIDKSKYDKKVGYIDSLDLPEATKDVLKIFAYRFIKIDFESVANYYAFNATDKEQEAIERLRLVLVDGGIEGFIEDDLLHIIDESNTDGDD